MIRTVSMTAVAVVTLAAMVAAPGCQTDRPGIRSNFYQQYTQVDAGPQEATETAEQVLQQLDLRNIESASTSLDGQVIGYTADGTKVVVSVERGIDDQTSEITARVGALGDPDLGGQIVQAIQQRLQDEPVVD